MVMLDILSFYLVGHFSDSLLSNFLGSVHIDMHHWIDSSNPVKNVEVLGSTSGKSNSELLQIRFATGMEARQYAGLNSAGELRIWTPADLVN